MQQQAEDANCVGLSRQTCVAEKCSEPHRRISSEEGVIAMVLNSKSNKLSTKFSRIASASLVIMLMVIFLVSWHQYLQGRSALLQRLNETLTERTLKLTDAINSLSEKNEFMRHWSEHYFVTASDALPASPLISMMEHHEKGNFFYIDQAQPPFQREEVGTIIVGGTSLLGKSALFNKKLGAALELFSFQHIVHERNPFIMWSYCVFFESIGNIFPWVPSEILVSSFQDTNTSEYEIGGGKTIKLVSPENNPDRIGVWTNAYIDKVTRKLMITRASPVYLEDRYEGFVCIDVSLDFLADFVKSVEPFDISPMLINNDGQVLAGLETPKKELPMADEVFKSQFNMGYQEVIQSTKNKFVSIQGFNVISLPIQQNGWHIIYAITEWQIAGNILSDFVVYPILIFCVILFILVIYFVLKTDYIYPSLALVDYIHNEASGMETTEPIVPKEWQGSFQRLSKIFELRTVTTNMPGGIFVLVRNGEGHLSLTFASQWISRLTQFKSHELIDPRFNWLDIFHDDDKERVLASIYASALHLLELNMECRLKVDKDKQIWIKLASHPRRVGEDIVWDGLMLDITDRKLAEQQLLHVLEEKEVLLREVSHRTKNNMQVIYSLLVLQSAGIDDPKVKEIFRETQNRIMSMAKAHQMLYQTTDLTCIDFMSYLQDLSIGLIKSYQSLADKVHLDFHGESVDVSLDTAITGGLVINELISNSLKYAFPENNRGEIRMRMFMDAEQFIHLHYGDDGVGFAENFDIKRASSLGSQLITNLVERQLKGKLEVGIHEHPEFRICFKNEFNCSHNHLVRQPEIKKSTGNL
jgi:two-component sensor histidine kinase/PAS domain-containing protein